MGQSRGIRIEGIRIEGVTARGHVLRVVSRGRCGQVRPARFEKCWSERC
jgi:hypothetical protein